MNERRYDEYRAITVFVPKDVRELFFLTAEDIGRRIIRAGGRVSPNTNTFRGQVLEILVAEYLATRGLEE